MEFILKKHITKIIAAFVVLSSGFGITIHAAQHQRPRSQSSEDSNNNNNNATSQVSTSDAFLNAALSGNLSLHNQQHSLNQNSHPNSSTEPQQSFSLRAGTGQAFHPVVHINEPRRLCAITIPIPQTLGESVLRNAPAKIKTIISMWQQYKTIPDDFLAKQLILVGPSGTGKSTLGKAISLETGIPFFMYRIPGLFDQFKDSAMAKLSEIFECAASLGKPCIIILDEIGILFTKHENKNDQEQGLLTNLWTLLDEYASYPILFIATCNELSEEILPTEDRFSGKVVEIPLPNLKQREEIITYYIDQNRTSQLLEDESNKSIEQNESKVQDEQDKSKMQKKKININFSGISPAILAKKTDGFSSRKLKSIIQGAFEDAWESGNPVIITMDNCIKSRNGIAGDSKEMNGSLSRKKFMKWTLQFTNAAVASAPQTALVVTGLFLQHKYNQQNLAAQQKISQQQMELQRAIWKDQRSWSTWFWGIMGQTASGALTAVFAKWWNKDPKSCYPTRMG